MATYPYFILSPSTVLSIAGLIRGPERVVATPAEDWRQARIDVVIPAFNEAANIVLCLASILHQTLRPCRIVLVDDGSRDGTLERAKVFCAMHDVELLAIQRQKPMGKTPTIRQQARELDSDVLFILDADTVLESTNYLERVVQELYQGVGIASAFGTILPQRQKDRLRAEAMPAAQAYLAEYPAARTAKSAGTLRAIRRGITNLYRETLYLFLQRCLYRGQLAFFGTMSNPVGCAVAYRRKYVKDLFDQIGPVLGDDLTNSEDIFIGFWMLNEGYRNIQLTDVHARTVEPEVHRLPRQIYLWSSAFLQACYYFDPLLRSPFKALERMRIRKAHKPAPARQAPARAGAGIQVSPMLATAGTGLTLSPVAVPQRDLANVATEIAPQPRANPQSSGSAAAGGDRRVAREAYRQAFGRERTALSGRPAGWILLMSAIEKIFFPTSLLIMLILRNWEALAVTAAAETAFCVAALGWVMKGKRLEYALKGVVATPLRYALIVSELFTIARFATDLWITDNRKWRK
jgi:glycosyltransferase involved in cell wall biosynthesis